MGKIVEHKFESDSESSSEDILMEVSTVHAYVSFFFPFRDSSIIVVAFYRHFVIGTIVQRCILKSISE